jgi:hypothetical protein
MTYDPDAYMTPMLFRGFFSRTPKPTESERIQELESELESTRAVLEFTKSSVCVPNH